MTALTLVLVLLSAVAHASWNLLLKRAADPEVFAWCLLVTATVLFAPLGVALAWSNPVEFPGLWFVAATIGLHIVYFVLLGRGYARGDLSLVYPVARGSGPMLVPVLAGVILGEEIALPGVIGIAGVGGGVRGVEVVAGRGLGSREVIGTWRGPNLRAAGGVIPIVEVLSPGEPESERTGANRGGRSAVQRIVLIDKQTGRDLGEPYRWEPGPGQQLTGYLDVWPGRVLLQMAKGVAAIETVAIEGDPGSTNGVN